MYRFSRQFMKFLTFEIVTPKILQPQGGVGGVTFVWIFWTIHAISRTFFFFFDFLTPPQTPLRPRWGGVDQICLCSNDSRINPHMRAKFPCSQTFVSKKGREVQTDTHTHIHTHIRTYARTHAHTKGHCSFI